MLEKRVLSVEEVQAARQAEENLLGAILVDASDGEADRHFIDAIAFIVKPFDFMGFDNRYPVNSWQCQNGRIYSAMLTCKGAPHSVNVAAELSRRGLLKQGDLSQLSHCIAELPTHLDWNDYAVAVRYYSQLRNSVKGEERLNQRTVGGVTLDPM